MFGRMKIPNLNSNPTLEDIREAIQTETPPEYWPGVEELGAGVERIGYKIGDWVVKQKSYRQDVCFEPKYQRAAARAGLRFAETHVEGKYVIQPYYTPLSGHELSGGCFCCRPGVPSVLIGLDLHLGNIGKDKEGNFVAFDW